MTKLNFSASCIRALVSQLKSSSENKAYEEAQYMNVALRMLDGVPTLQMTTQQPTFGLTLRMPLLDRDGAEQGDMQVEAQTDGEHQWRVRTAELDKALSGCGQMTTLMEMRDDGTITLNTGRNLLTVAGECCPMAMAEDTEFRQGCTLGIDPLLNGVKTAMEMAAVKGNDLEKSGIHLVISPRELRIEGANPIALVVTGYDSQVWSKAPEGEHRDVVLTVDAVRHLLRSFSSYGAERVTLEAREDVLVATSGQVVMESDLQPVNYFDSKLTSCISYTSGFQTSRHELLLALRSMRAIGEKQVQMKVFANALTLHHVDATRTTCRTNLECMPLTAVQEMPESTYPIAPLISALASSLTAEKATLKYHGSDCPLCMEVGDTKLFVR